MPECAGATEDGAVRLHTACGTLHGAATRPLAAHRLRGHLVAARSHEATCRSYLDTCRSHLAGAEHLAGAVGAGAGTGII